LLDASDEEASFDGPSDASTEQTATAQPDGPYETGTEVTDTSFGEAGRTDN
jgi:hypothetical protein